MFENLSQKMAHIVKKLRNEAYLTEENMKDTLRQVRLALLEADVALPIVRSILEKIQNRALGEKVLMSLSPGQALIGIVHQELTILMGGGKTIAENQKDNFDLNLRSSPSIILLAGLQGAGKTTTAGKLAHLLSSRLNKKVITTSCDIYRPAAIEQLRIVTQQAGAEWFASDTNQKPIDIALNAVQYAHRQFYDVLVIDTAGRLSLDDIMMQEISDIQKHIHPNETLYVVDAMQGQDAVNTAKIFGQKLQLTGIILSKLDGDARGGAALSVHQITQQPIKFIGVSEQITGIEIFYAERMAHRILGMGDVLALVEEAQRNANYQSADKITEKIKSGKNFDFTDFANQLAQMNKMGGLSSMIDKLPIHIQQATGTKKIEIADRQIQRMIGMINSMTPNERAQPDTIKASRKRRIANGSGVQVQEVNRMIIQFQQIRDMMKKMNKGGMAKMMRNIKNIMPKFR